MYATLVALTAGVGALVYMWHLEQQTNRVLLQNIKRELQLQEVRNEENAKAVPGIDTDTPVGSWANVNSYAKDCVVQIFSQVAQFNWIEPYKTPQQGQSYGTGFFITPYADIVTNAHVVDQAKAISIQIPSLGKRRFGAYIIGVSPERDLAVLRLYQQDRLRVEQVRGSIAYLPFGDSDQVQRADDIMALGFPLGQQSLKSTTGVVSGREHLDGRHMIQTSAAINPGNSGGPSLTRDGYVIGVNSSKIAGDKTDNVGYIIPANEVKLFLRQLEQLPDSQEVKFLRRPFLGVVYNNGNETLAEFLNNPQPGAPYITDVFHGSPLHRAGIQRGDMLYEINGHQLDPYGEMYVPWSEDKVAVSDYVGRLMPGDEVHLVIYRHGKRIETTTTFTETELPPIRFRYPGYEDIPYEVIGGLVVMPLSLNHIPYFASRYPELTKYMDIKNQLEPHVLVTHVLPDSQAYRARAIASGSMLCEINGHTIYTIDDVRRAIWDSLSTGYVTITTKGPEAFVALPLDRVIREEDRLASMYFYRVTPFARQLQAAYYNQKTAVNTSQSSWQSDQSDAEKENESKIASSLHEPIDSNAQQSGNTNKELHEQAAS